MDTKSFLKVMQKEAAERGISLEQLVDSTEKGLTLCSQSLPRHGRLACVEKLVREKKATPEQADMILRNNPIGSDEMREQYLKCKRTLLKEYGLEIPDFGVKYIRRQNNVGLTAGIGSADWVHRIISLPAKGDIHAPLIIAHEQGHAYQMEHSKLYYQLRLLRDCRQNWALLRLRQQNREIIEGWAEFVS